jgi:hypothetical protein
MLEIKLCGVCGKYQCAENHEPDWAHRTMEVNQATMQACSDCEEYAPFFSMTKTPAGNVICPKCAKRRQRLEASRAQLSMFGQAGLFES